MRKSRHDDPVRRLQVGGLFLVNFEPGRIFWGTIRNLSDDDGREITTGDAVVEDGLMIGRGKTLPELRKNLSEVCHLKLEHDLHGDKGVSSEILKTAFFHN